MESCLKGYEPADIFVCEFSNIKLFYLVLQITTHKTGKAYRSLCLNNGKIEILSKSMVDIYDQPYSREIHGQI